MEKLTAKEYKEKYVDKKSPKRKQQPEFELQKLICTYLKLKYPDIMFMSDTIAAVHLTKPQQQRNKSVQCPDFHCPDILIFAKRGNYGALFIELKIKTPFKKNGNIKSSQNDHLRKQLQTINKLMWEGYYACFSWSYSQTKLIIDSYLVGTI